MRILAYTSPARGHLYPLVPILAELRERGHEITLLTLPGALAAMRELGFDAQAVAPAIVELELDDWKARTTPGMGRRALATFAARSRHEVPDLTRAIAEHDPQLLLIDVNCWGAAAVAEASGLAWGMYSPFLLMIPSRELPPFGIGLRPRRGPVGAARDALLHRVSPLAYRHVLGPVNALRQALGLAPLGTFMELFARPPLLLSLTAEGFEYPRGDWPANVRLVGAPNWSPPADPPGWLEELGDPLVLVTCSTERQRDQRLLHTALRALPGAGMSVLATSAAHDPRQFGAPPPGSRVERFVAHEAVLERTACVVCHGGMGITQKALAAGVPVVVVPCGRDQPETARRVEYARAGVRLAPRRLSPGRLLRAVRAALELREGARRVSRAYAAAGGAVAAAEEIERLGSSTRAGTAANRSPRAST